MAEADIAWMSIKHGAVVCDSAGGLIGRVVATLGDEQEALHSIAILHHALGHELSVPADRVTSITPDRVATSLSAEESHQLERYHGVRPQTGFAWKEPGADTTVADEIAEITKDL